MTILDDLYAAGAAHFKNGDFAAAEESFRRLLAEVPLAEGKAHGRAAYSLALTLLERGRIAEAVQMLHIAIGADPALQRARDRLTQIEAANSKVAFATGLPAPSAPGGLVGVAHRIRIGNEPDPIFGQGRNNYVRFRLEIPDGRQATIEIRGQRIVGSVEEGDIIEVPGPWRPGAHLSVVNNLTTGEVVKAVRSPIRVAQWVTLVAFVIGFVVFVVWAYNQVR